MNYYNEQKKETKYEQWSTDFMHGWICAGVIYRDFSITCIERNHIVIDATIEIIKPLNTTLLYKCCNVILYLRRVGNMASVNLEKLAFLKLIKTFVPIIVWSLKLMLQSFYMILSVREIIKINLYIQRNLD